MMFRWLTRAGKLPRNPLDLGDRTGERGIGKRLAGPPTAMWWSVKVLYRAGVVFQLASVGILLVASLRRLVSY
jgi:hypothetical protein